MIIRRLGVLSVAKISGIIAAAFGLLIGILLFLVGGVAGGAMSAMQSSGMDGAPAGGLGMFAGMGAIGIVVLPIVYGICGFIGGAIQAFVYNLAAKFVGGIRIETE